MRSAPFLANNCIIEAALFHEPMSARVVWRQGTAMGVHFPAAIERSDRREGLRAARR